MNICISEKPEYNNSIIPVRIKYQQENPHERLRETLDSLFKFYFLAKKNITIQEINSLVKFKLYRKTRKVYYLVNTGLLLKESHREPMEEYYHRIFSIPIIDKNIRTTKPKVNKKKRVVTLPNPDRTVLNELITRKSQFIENDLESLSSDNSESEISDNSESDYSDEEDSETENETECHFTEDLVDDMDNLDFYDEPEETEEHDYY
jgi:hypothetical protein